VFQNKEFKILDLMTGIKMNGFHDPELFSEIKEVKRLPKIPQSPIIVYLKKNLGSGMEKEDLENIINFSKDFLLPNFHPEQVAFQLTLIDWGIFSQIKSKDLLCHSTEPSLSIQASMDFFNYLTRIIEFSILEPFEASARAETIQCWIKVVDKLGELRNFNSLKGVISGLQTKPISRLKTSWQQISRKYISILERWTELLSEQNNYQNYRALLLKCKRPAIPFLGVIIYDLTYINALKKVTHKDSSSESKLTAHENKLNELIFHLEFWTTGPPYDPQHWQCGSKKHREFYFGKKDEKYSCDPMFCLHWLLTRQYADDKTITEYSILREPEKKTRGSLSKTVSPVAESQRSSLSGYRARSLSNMTTPRDQRHKLQSSIGSMFIVPASKAPSTLDIVHLQNTHVKDNVIRIS
jgi:hypothetical protein